ncbi:MAG: protein kinase [Planctomyces sp.]|nr:protein kinase [Planctomyces sp.]
MSDQKPNLDSLFEAAVEIESAEERAEFLDKSCSENLELRKQLERLLQSHEQAGSFLDRSPAELEATILTDDPDGNLAAVLHAGLAPAFTDEQAIVVGDGSHSVLKMLAQTLNKVPRVALRESPAKVAEPIVRPKSAEMPNHDSDSRYQLQGEIARGGMGAILKGRDTDLGRDLAIKVLLDAHKDKPDVVNRFIEEAQIGGQLQHPGIAPVYELGQFSDRRPFFSMKLVKGQTFSRFLADRQNLAEDRGRFIGIFEQICQTMAYAHSRGVIHRDLKPANIMVGAFGEVQVMDWGLAKVLPTGGVVDERRAKDQDQSIIQTLRSRTGAGDGSDLPIVGSIGSHGSETLAGSVMGTPAYMPPEQALGEIDNLDERADVFGLGAILCEILTGQPPYVGTDGTQVYRMATRGKLSDCFARLDACEVDAELVAIAKQCLELEPKDRPRDAGVLAERVTMHLASVESRLHAAEVNRAAEAARAEEALQTAKEHELAASAERRARKLQMGLAVVVLCVMTIGGIAATWTAAVQSQLKNDALRAEQTAIRAREKEAMQRGRAEEQQALAEKQQTRAEQEEARAKEAMQRAEDEKLRSINLLADMQTERGLQAAREGQGAKAVLWFANAAALTPHDRQRQIANQRRAQTWSSDAMMPVALLKPGKESRRVEFQLGGSLLLTVGQNGLRVWDWRNEVALPWSEQFPAVIDAAMSPDGKTIAALFSNDEVQLLDPTTGTALRGFNTVKGMSLVEWSPDSARVAVAGTQLQVWNVSNEPAMESDWPHPAKIGGVRFSRSGSRVLSSSEDRLVRVYAIDDATLPAPLFAPVEHLPESWASAHRATPVFCDNDRLFVTISGSTHQPAMYEVATGKLQAVDWKLSGYFDRSLETSSDGRWIVVGGPTDGALLSTDGITSFVMSHANHLHQALIAPNGQSLATLGYDGIARVFPLRDSDQGKVGPPTIIPQQHTQANGAFSSDSQALAIAASEQIVIWERKPASPIVGHVAWADHSWRPRPSFDGQFVTEGVYHEYYAGFSPKQAELKVARMADGSAAGPTITLTGLLLDSCICSDNASVAAVTVDGTNGLLSLFDIATGTPKWPALVLPAPPLSVAARPGRPLVAVLCQDGQVVVVDLARAQIEQTHVHPGTGNVPGPPNARVAYSPDGATLVVVLPNQNVAIYDAQTGEPRCPNFSPLIQGGFTRSIAFSPDSRFLATAVTGKNMAQVWSLATGEKVGIGMSHPGDEFGLWSITFSPDGKQLVTGHKDGRIRTFDWRTGEMVGTPLQHPDEVNDIVFTPDGRHLLACVQMATLHVWDVATSKLAVPLLPELRQDGASTETVGLAQNRVVVNSNTRYSVLDLSTLLPPIEEDLSSLLRRAELATNHKLQNGELVPLESHEWSTRWEQLVAARQTPEQMAELLAAALDDATDEAAQSLVIARATRRGLLEQLHVLRPKSLPLSVAVAIELSRQGRLDEAIKHRDRLLAMMRESGFRPVDGSEERMTDRMPILLNDLSLLLTIDAPRGKWLTLEPTDVTSTIDMKFTLLPNGLVLATSGENATEPTIYTIRSSPKIKQIAALRLNIVPHASLPDGGSGLFGGGFNLAEVRVRIRRNDGTEIPVTLSHASASYVRPLDSETMRQDGPWAVLDGDLSSHWTGWPHILKSHWLMLVASQPCELKDDDELIVELESGNSKYPQARLGHFELSVSEEPRGGFADELLTAVRNGDLPTVELFAAACLINGESQVALEVLHRDEERDRSNNDSAKREGDTLLRALLTATALQQLGQRELAQQTVRAAVDEMGLEEWPHSLTGFYQRILRDEAGLSMSDFIRKREQAAARDVTERLAWEAMQAAQVAERELAMLTKAIELNPTETAGYLTRATYLSRLGRWKESAADFDEVLKRQQTDRIAWLNVATTNLMAGDEAAYRDLCSKMLVQFRDSDDPVVVSSLCKVCLLRPEAVELSAIPMAKLNAIAIREFTERKASFSVMNAGLAAYRAGRFDESLEWLGKTTNLTGFAGAQVFATRAMAEEKLGRHDDAVKSLALAEALTPDVLADLGTSRYKGSLPVSEWPLYRDNVVNELLRREASLLIHQSEARTTPFVPHPTSNSTTSEQWAVLGEWAEAAKASLQLTASNPRDRVEISRRAALQLLADDVEGYRKTCQTNLTTFTGTLTTDEAESLTKTCLLSDSGVELTRLPIKQLRDAVDDPQQKTGRSFYLATSMLAAYRAGQWELVLSESQKQTKFSGYTGALSLVVRSMAEEKLGQHEKALESLENAEKLIPTELRTLGTAEYTGPLPVAATTVHVDWLLAEVIRSEAGHLIRGDAISAHRVSSFFDSAEFDQALRRDQFAMQGNWAKAAEAAETDQKDAQQDRGLFAYTAALLMLAGDVEGHRQFCDRALKPFEPITDAAVAESLCKGSLLSSDAVRLDRLPIQIMRDGFANESYQPAWEWFRACNTLVLYREGKFGEAILETKMINPLSGHVGALALVTRAMSEEKLGQHEQALRTLAQAETIIPAELSTLGTEKHRGKAIVPHDTISVDWLIPEILRREATAMIRK